MIINPRVESPELLTLRYLSSRKQLLEKDLQHYMNLEIGFIGEKHFDSLCENSLNHWKITTSILLEYQHSFFQMDSLGFAQEELYLFDIKNFEGDFIVKGDTWQSTSGMEIKNPLHQLSRYELLLKRFLHEHGVKIGIKPYLIFINPHFTLYNAPLQPNIVLPTQVDFFLGKLQSIKPTYQKKHQNLIELLLSSNHPFYPNSQTPPYQYDELNKGIFCNECHTLIEGPIPGGRGKLSCPKCDSVGKYEESILVAVKELKLLFPDRKITTSAVFEWCGGLIHRKSIQRALTNNLTHIGNGRYKFYI